MTSNRSSWEDESKGIPFNSKKLFYYIPRWNRLEFPLKFTSYWKILLHKFHINKKNSINNYLSKCWLYFDYGSKWLFVFKVEVALNSLRRRTLGYLKINNYINNLIIFLKLDQINNYSFCLYLYQFFPLVVLTWIEN